MITSRQMGSRLRNVRQVWVTRNGRRVNTGEIGVDFKGRVTYQCAPRAGSTSRKMIFDDCFSFGADEWLHIAGVDAIEINVAVEKKTYRCPMQRAIDHSQHRRTTNGKRVLVPVECWTVYDIDRKVVRKATLT